MKENIVPGCPKALGGLVALNNKKKQNLGYEGPLESGVTSNSMGIEVKGITVIAINMMENGNAIADSDIILNSVQYINFIGPDDEIGEKLK
ncbi:MAG: hypothetical protein MUO26_05850 [Methanotrichaceae archaeon]|nr:hypothetical protein [Methanotrichaceae archaeon]